MITLDISEKDLDLLSEHLQGNETEESDAVINSIVQINCFVQRDEDSISTSFTVDAS